MSVWKECKIADAPFRIIDGDRGTNYPKQDEFSDNGYCLFLNAKNVTTNGFNFNECYFISKEKDLILRQGKLQKYDIILTTRGTVGNIGFFNDKIPYDNMRINSGMVIIRSNQVDIIPEYTHHLFKFLKSDFDVFATGSAQPQLPIRDLNEITFLLPPLPEQKAIAGVLSNLDDKIDLLHGQNKTLEGMAEALWRKMFVEDVDERWLKGFLGDLVTFHNGKSRPVQDVLGSIPIYGGNGILGQTNIHNFENESIIIGRVGAYCGSLFIVNGPVWITDNALLAKPINTGTSKYLFYLLKTLDLNTFAEGSSHPLLTQTLLKSIEIDIPPINVMNKYDEHISDYLTKIDFNNETITSLSKMRDSLLPKLMSGDVRVKL